MELTLAEELLLVCRTPLGKDLAGSVASPRGVIAALLVDLALRDRMAVADGRLIATDGSGTLGTAADPEAEILWKRVRADHRPRRPKAWVEKESSAKVNRRVLSGLAERGVLRAEHRRVLGLFPSTRWTETDPAPAVALRARLYDAMLGVRADDRAVALLLLVDACGVARQLFPDHTRKARMARIAKLSRGPWTGEASGEAVQAIAKGAAQAITEAQQSSANGA